MNRALREKKEMMEHVKMTETLQELLDELMRMQYGSLHIEKTNSKFKVHLTDSKRFEY